MALLMIEQIVTVVQKHQQAIESEAIGKNDFWAEAYSLQPKRLDQPTLTAGGSNDTP